MLRRKYAVKLLQVIIIIALDKRKVSLDWMTEDHCIKKQIVEYAATIGALHYIA